MTTPLAHEPMPGDGLVPYMSTLVDRLYQRLPEVYRTMDAVGSTWAFKRYLGGLLVQAGIIDDTITAIAGERAVGPATPEPWALRPDELATWQSNRRVRASALGDPMQADPAWLPWLAQLVGARLDPAASVDEQRDTIRYATSGWRGGTRQAIADAARTALTGTRYAQVMPHTTSVGGSPVAGTVWDITIVTRSSETPDPGAVLGAILRKGVKPAGTILHHAVYGATWDQVEATLPTWADWESRTWDQLEQTGLSYQAIPSNLMPNPSFETDTTGWSALTNSTVGRVLGGVDGVGMGRVTATASGSAGARTPNAPITAPGTVLVGLSIRGDQARAGQYVVEYRNGANAVISSTTTPIATLPADEWQRQSGVFTLPAGTASVTVTIQLNSMAAAELFDLDAVDVRRMS